MNYRKTMLTRKVCWSFFCFIFIGGLFFCKEEPIVQQPQYDKFIYDLVRVKPLEFSNFQFDENRQLTQFWKKNPARYSVYPPEEKWKNTQVTFQLDKKIFLNVSRDALHFSKNSKIEWEINSGEYELSWDYGFLTDSYLDNLSGELSIEVDGEKKESLMIDKESREKWKYFSSTLKIQKKLAMEWKTNEDIHLFVGSPILRKTQEQSSKPNVILIIIDSLRRDSLGCNPNSWKVTPVLDEICKDGIRFQRHYANANWTKPSMVSLLYGEYASNLGIINDGFKVPIHEKIIFYNNLNRGLVNILRDEGYVTTSVMNNVFFLDYTSVGVDLGFQEIDQIGKDIIDTEEITQKSIATIRKHQKHPFFLHINYNTPHVPYQPPAKHLEEVKKLTKTGKKIPHYMIENYLGEVRYTDAEIGKIIAELKKLELYDSTYILITSDHGDLFSEHHTFEANHVTGTRWGHGQTLFEEEIAIPLVIKPPRKIQEKIYKKEIELPSSGISMVPTLLGFMKLPKQNMRGKDYSDYFYYGTNPPIEEEIYTEGRMMESVIRENKKFIRLFPGYTNLSLHGTIPPQKEFKQVYDLKSDPDEKLNIFEKTESEFAEIFQQNKLKKNSFFLVFPKNTNSGNGNFYFPGEIYSVRSTSNISYEILHRTSFRFQKYGTEEAELQISTTSPEMKYSLDFSLVGNYNQYKIGAWGLPANRELTQIPELLYSPKRPELFSKFTNIWLYNDGLLKFPGGDSEKMEMGSEVKDILKSWGYIHE